MLKRLVPLLAAACFAAPATAQAATPGLNIATGPDVAEVDRAAATGAKYVRMFALWRALQPGGATFNQAELDNWKAVADRAKAHGIGLILALTEAPAWANGSSDPFVPPTDNATYAAFAGAFADQMKGKGVAAYEIWNEPDEDGFWHPAPDVARYTDMLRQAYAKIKQADPAVTVLTGPTTGNNYGWIEGIYANGGKGSFDAVAVHTDTACLVDGPDSFYRENGRLARFTFLGYREVRASMLANGDDKEIWMTELGWSSTNGGPTSCQRGRWAGQKPDGVSRAVQAQFLEHAFACMAQDPYVKVGAWFTFRDTTANNNELNNYGLLDTAGNPKPSHAAFLKAGSIGAGPCGDFDAPAITIVKPQPGEQFVEKVDVQAHATDNGVGLARISFAYDDNKEIRNFTDALQNGNAVGLAPWQNSGKLALGPHTIIVTALDKNGNTSRAEVAVEKVKTLRASLTPTFKLPKKVSCKGRACTFKGSLSRGKAGTPSINGKVAVEWQWRNKQGKWRKLSGGLKPANKPFSFKLKAKKAGRWRVRTVYRGQAPWKKVTSKWVSFRVR